MLNFKPIDVDNINNIIPFEKYIPSRSCDYTPGCLLMWSKFMHYEYAIEQNTLFISCLSEKDLHSEAFLVPIGELSLGESVNILQEYCNHNSRTLRFTAVVEQHSDAVASLLPDYSVEQLEGWSDYVYSANALATLQGHVLNKKRNRYNKFLSTYPDFEFVIFEEKYKNEIYKFLSPKSDDTTDPMKLFEEKQTLEVVSELQKYRQEAALIKIDDNIVAFTLGEVINDTLYIHIEKALRDCIGASEAINHLFAAKILEKYNGVEFINREEDLGEEGLRMAKESYHPIEMINRNEILRK